jgi:methyl-accepting chemotaxis protein
MFTELSRTVSAKIAVAVVVVSTLVLAAAGVGLLLYLRGHAQAALTAKAELTAMRLALATAAPLWNTDQAGAQAITDAELADPEVVAILIFNGEASSADLFLGRSRQGDTLGAATALPSADGIMRSVPVMREDQLLGTVQLLVDRGPLLAQQRQLTLALLIFIPLVQGVLVLATILVLRRLVVRPLAHTVLVLEAMAKGDHDSRLKASSADEIGRLANAVNRTLDRMQRMLELATIKADEVAVASASLVTIGKDLRGSAESRRSEAEQIAGSAHTLLVHVQAIGAATVEMTASISEIARTASDATAAGNRTLRAVDEMAPTMLALSTASEQIGSVITTIQAIAGRTNLLALNATIEAASAGDAGRGFAVVAAEVKNLALQTQQAASGIVAQAQGVQQATAAIRQRLLVVTEATQQVSAMQQTVSAAVEEQAATTNEMNRNTANAIDDILMLSSTATALAAATGETLRSADATDGAARKLQHQAADLLDATRGGTSRG